MEGGEEGKRNVDIKREKNEETKGERKVESN